MLDNASTASVLDARDAVEAIAAVFDELGRGRAADRNKTSIYVPRDDPSLWYRYASMDGASRQLGMAAVRLKSDMVRRARHDGVLRETKYTGQPGSYGGLVLLFSADDGRLLAILNDGYIQHLRVGATYGVGMDRLARADATAVGMIVGRDGADLSGVVLCRAAYQLREGLQPDAGERRVLRRRDGG